jgi:hypothetical protein
MADLVARGLLPRNNERAGMVPALRAECCYGEAPCPSL